MQYTGLQQQISRNNRYSILLMIAFPTVLLGMFYVFFFFADKDNHNADFLGALPFVLIGVSIWFLIAWLGNAAMIRLATGAKPLERKENKRVYNLVENLCIQQGMTMPAIYVIEDDSLNAFASGLSPKNYSVTLSRGIVNKLEDDELEGVIAHELTHIRNKDTRLLIISIIFVGIFSFLAEMALRSLRFSGGKKKDGGYIILIAIAVSAVCYLISIFLRFGVSRSREYLADAGAAEMTKKPYALASALRKVDADPLIEAVTRSDVAQLFIDNPKTEKKSFFSSLFDTHPPIQKRIELLEQFV
ncbi:MAG: M48 family metallopeptidase [Chitinophagaceae bacterium]|nr:M48 family metallopeptidase [Chitinophagaceae bacterium]